MSAAKTRRKGKKGDDLPNLQDALAEAQNEPTTKDAEPAKDTANTEVSSAGDSADNATTTTKGTTGANKGSKGSKAKKDKGAAKDTKEPKAAADQPAKADKYADVTDAPAAPEAPDAPAETETKTEAEAESEAKPEAQPDEAAAKEAERQARIAKAKAQAKAFAEARARERALKQGKEGADGADGANGADGTRSAESTAKKAKDDQDTAAPADSAAAANTDIANTDAAKTKDGEGSEGSKGSDGERKPDFYDDEPPKNSGANLQAMLAGLTLAIFAALCVIGIITVEHNTEEKIQTYRNAQEQKLLNTMLPGVMEQAQGQVTFQCKLLSDPRIGKNMQTYLVQDERKQTLGLIANYSTSRGYSNPLILLAGVDMQGNVMRIEVKLSKETPGIGDKVEHRKGNYLDQFVGWNLDNADWEVRKFGGQFDYITGATVTSRAVVLATKDLLEVLKDTPHPDLLPNCR